MIAPLRLVEAAALGRRFGRGKSTLLRIRARRSVRGILDLQIFAWIVVVGHGTEMLPRPRNRYESSRIPDAQGWWRR